MKPLPTMVLLVACAGSLSGQKSKRSCSGDPPDSAWFARIPVYRDCEVDRPAQLRGTPPRNSFAPPPSGISNGRCYKAEFEFVVDSLGDVEQTTIRPRSGNDKDLEDAVRETLPRFKYVPAVLADRPVRQVVAYKATVSTIRVVSSGGPPPAPARPPARC